MKITFEKILWGIFFILVISSFIAPFANAALNVGALAADITYKQNQLVDLKYPCINNGTYCLDTAECNITVFMPDTSVLVNNLAMTNNIAWHNYTLNPAETNVTGTYQAQMICQDGENGYSTFNFDITSSGYESENNSLAVIIGLGMIMIMFLLASYLWNEKQLIIKSAFIILSMLTALIISQSIIQMADFSQSGAFLTSMLKTENTLLITMIVFLIAYIFIYIMIQLFKQLKEIKNAKLKSQFEE